MTGILFILLYSAIMWLAIEIAVMLFVATGLNKPIARYQVISMLTATGFTSEESKLIVDHPIRRRISAAVILFGYFSLAVMISSIATILSNDLRINVLLIVITVFMTVLLVLKSGLMKNFLGKLFEHVMEEAYNLEDWPLKTALSLESNDMVTLLEIHEDGEYSGQKAGKLLERKDDIHVLFIRRGDAIVRKLVYEETLKAGDLVMIFGDVDIIKERFSEMLYKKTL